jgi:N-acetylglucosaminylphosphatidylinositol deacetylase
MKSLRIHATWNELWLLFSLAGAFFFVRMVSFFLIKEVPLPEDRYLLLVAHPDDESMFFGPTFQRLRKKEGGLTVVVATNGEKGGDSAARQEEISGLCKEAGVPLFLLGGEDGGLFCNKDMQHKVMDIVNKTGCTAIITFDADGVSGHSDHAACCAIACEVCVETGTKLYSLETKSLLLKYGFFGVGSVKRRGCITKTRSLGDFMEARRRMLVHHKSQMLWYRYLYLLFSTYFDLNVLLRIK